VITARHWLLLQCTHFADSALRSGVLRFLSYFIATGEEIFSHCRLGYHMKADYATPLASQAACCSISLRLQPLALAEAFVFRYL